MTEDKQILREQRLRKLLAQTPDSDEVVRDAGFMATWLKPGEDFKNPQLLDIEADEFIDIEVAE